MLNPNPPVLSRNLDCLSYVNVLLNYIKAKFHQMECSFVFCEPETSTWIKLVKCFANLLFGGRNTRLIVY